MFGIFFDVVAAYALRRLCSTKFQFFIFGLIAGFFSSLASSLLSFLLLNESPAIVVLNALSGIFINSIIIWIFIWIDFYIDRKIRLKKNIVDKIIEKERLFDLNEVDNIKSVLKKFEHIKTDVQINESLKTNLTKLSTEELLSKLETNSFADEALPTVIHVLLLRSLNPNS
jgi:hypothetical protein